MDFSKICFVIHTQKVKTYTTAPDIMFWLSHRCIGFRYYIIYCQNGLRELSTHAVFIVDEKAVKWSICYWWVALTKNSILFDIMGCHKVDEIVFRIFLSWFEHFKSNTNPGYYVTTCGNAFAIFPSNVMEEIYKLICRVTVVPENALNI